MIAATTRPAQSVQIVPFSQERLLDELGLETPPLSDPRLSDKRQLRAILRHVGELGCQSVAIEAHYIDRDFIEDYSLFYSRSLAAYPNYCTRLLFFKLAAKSLGTQLSDLREEGHKQSQQEFYEACREFSRSAYLGFAVIRPLPGCPVGRTVIRPYPEESGAGHIRNFQCTRPYVSHFAGLRLVVRGLAFQEQDLGVSACATTALWSALQKIEVTEGIPGATPAQITLAASRYALPFGRALPSDGLSVDQMCQATRAFGVSPQLIRTDDKRTARAYLHSVAFSGVPAVLILVSPDERTRHAVTLTGIKLRKKHAKASGVPGIDDLSGDLKAVYVHDDRYGAYFPAELVTESAPASRPHLQSFPLFSLPVAGNAHQELWHLTHLLLPLHNKTRLSFDSLRVIGINLVSSLIAFLGTAHEPAREDTIRFSTFISRGVDYLETLLTISVEGPRLVHELSKSVPISRFVSIIRIANPNLGTIDILLDSTSTERNPKTISAVVLESRALSGFVGKFLQHQIDIPIIL